MDHKINNYPNRQSHHAQDAFVLCMLQNKSKGHYVEIGTGHYKDGNNTFLLEQDYN